MRAVLIGLLTILALPAWAEPIPASVLENMRASCMRNHGSKPGGAVYCTCMTSEYSKTFTLQSLATIEGEIQEKVNRGMSPQQAATQTPEVMALERTCQRASARN